MRRNTILRGIILGLGLLLLSQGAKATTTWFPVPQFFSGTGVPLAGGQVFTYSAGTSIQQPSYTDSTGLVQNPNPLILDSTGKPMQGIWLSSAGYKIVVEDSNGNIQWFQDNIVQGAATSSTAFSSITAATNSNAGNFIASGNTWNFNAATALLIPIAAGCVPTASSSICYDSTANKYVFGQNGSTVSFGLSSSACAANSFVNTPATATAAASCAQPSAANLSNGTTGSGAVVLANTPTLITPVLGAATGTSLNLSATGVLSTTAQSGSGSICMTSSCAMTSPALTTPTIGGTTISAVPQMTWDATAVGSSLIGSSIGVTIGTFPVNSAITVKNFTAGWVAVFGGCTTTEQWALQDNGSTIDTITLVNNTNSYTHNLSLNVAAGHTLTVTQTRNASGGCTGNMYNGGFTVVYIMQ